MTTAAFNDTGVLHEWAPTPDTFAARLAMVRQAMGWNVKEAALACSLNPTTWRKWEMNDAMPRDYMAAARAISGRTGVSIEWLVFGPGERVIRAELPTRPEVSWVDDTGEERRTTLRALGPDALVTDMGVLVPVTAPKDVFPGRQTGDVTGVTLLRAA